MSALVHERFVVRPALPAEAHSIAALDKAMWGDWANPVTIYRQLIDLYPEAVLVAHDLQGRYAGCAVGLFRTELKQGWVLSIDVAEPFRGQGLGRQFAVRLLEVFRSLAIEKVTAIIHPVNTPSQKLFASFGFRLEGRERDYFGSGEDQERWGLALVDGTLKTDPAAR